MKRQLIFLGLMLMTATAFAQTPTFSRVQKTSAREIMLTLSGSATEVYRFDISTNLTLWEPLYTFTNLSSTTTFTDTESPFMESRLYRAVHVARTNLTGDHITTSAGDVVIHPVTHASFVMEWNGMYIYNDPDVAGYPGIPKADIVLVGHEHGDHFDTNTINAVTTATSRIVVPQYVYDRLATQQKTIATILGNGQSTEINGVNIEAVPAYNGNHPVGRGNGYVVTIGGKRFYMSGDTGATTEMRALANIDVAFLAMNSFTMTVADAASAARSFRPKIIFPYHYATGNPALLKSQLSTNGIQVRERVWYP